MRVEPDCWRCARRNDSVQVVWPTVVRDAKICVIGEYPGFAEDKAGVTFCGRSGGVLRDAIRKVGADPAKDVSYANAVLCFGGRNKTKVKRKQVEACSRHMWRAIRAAYTAGTRVFVCAGAAACEAVMGHEVKVSQVNGDRMIAKPPMSVWNAVALEDFCYDRDITLPMGHDGIPPALIEDSGFVSSAFMQRVVEHGFAYEEPPDLQVVPTYNPNYFIQSGVGEEYKMEKALRSACYWADGKEPEKHEKDYKAIFDADEAIQYIDSIIDLYANGLIEFFALDYETVGPPENMVKGALNPFLPGGRILTINLSHTAHFARVIYLTHPASTMTVAEQAVVAKKTCGLLEKVPVAGANIRFDLHWSRYKLGARKWTIAHDTQLMNYAVFLGLGSNDLKTLVAAHIEGDADYESDLKEFLNALPKEERHYANIPEDKMTLYGSHDVDVIHQLVPILTDQLKDNNQYEQYQLFLLHPYPAFIEMEQNGAFIHNEMVSELLVEYTRRVEEPMERFKTDPEFAAYWNKWMMYKIKLAQEKRAAYKSERHKKKKIQPKELDINFGSAQQVAVLLFSIAGLPTWGDKGQKTKKLEKIFPNGIPTTKDEALENIRELVVDQDGPAVKLLDLVMEHRTDSKILSTYLKKAYENCPVPHEKPDWWDTRHTLNDPRRYEAELYDIGAQSASFNLTTTRTGRTSSDGPNIQQVTKKMRRMYVPRPVPPEDELRAMGLDPKLNTRRLIANFDVGQAELRMLAVACQDPTMLAILSDPKRDIHREIAAVAYNKPISAITSTERTSVKRIVFGCVPMDTMALTRDGWKTYDEIEEGDLVLGYRGGETVWTPVRYKVKYADAPLVRMSHGNGFEATVTPNHRWVGDVRRRSGENRGCEPCIFQTDSITSEHRIFTSAPTVSSRVLEITANEAALIGWLYTDGGVKWSPLTRRASQGSDGRRRKADAKIYQTKKKWIPDIERMLASIPHVAYPERNTGQRVWQVRSKYMRELWKRARLHDITLLQFVTFLDAQQRQAFLDAAWMAEGHQRSGGYRQGSSKVITQNEGEVLEALRVAVLMEGYRPTTSKGSEYNGNVCKKLNYSKPLVTGQRLKIEPVDGLHPVWCIKTDCETWVMRQGDQIMLTGNTAYGRSARAVAAQLKIPLDEAESIQAALFAMMPGAKGWINDRHLEVDMSGVVVTPTGRSRNLSMHQNAGERHRRAVNTPVQGGASDLTLWATGWIHKWMQENKVNSILWNFVHDSIDLDVYPQEAEMLMRVCRHYFSVATPKQFPWYNVPLVLEFEFGTDWEKQVACEYVDDTREIKFEGKPDRVTNVFRTFKPLLTDIVLDPEWTMKAGRKNKDGDAAPADVWVSARFY